MALFLGLSKNFKDNRASYSYYSIRGIRVNFIPCPTNLNAPFHTVSYDFTNNIVKEFSYIEYDGNVVFFLSTNATQSNSVDVIGDMNKCVYLNPYQERKKYFRVTDGHWSEMTNADTEYNMNKKLYYL